MFGKKSIAFRRFGEKFSAVAKLGSKMIPQNKQELQQMRKPSKRTTDFYDTQKTDKVFNVVGAVGGPVGMAVALGGRTGTRLTNEIFARGQGPKPKINQNLSKEQLLLAQQAMNKRIYG
jgi:hypothetical protein